MPVRPTVEIVEPGEITLGSLANIVLRRSDVRRAAFITSPSTGNPALRDLDTLAANELLLVQYQSDEHLRTLVEQHRDSFDVVFTDPFHTYDASQHCLDACLNLLRPGGLLLSHDCVPPPEYVDVTVSEHEWSGVTFAAFRDLMNERGAAWCTLDADFGIGVAIAPETTARRLDENTQIHTDEDRWSRERHDLYFLRYLADPFGFMQTMCADRWEEAVALLRSHGDLRHLAATFVQWDDLLPSAMRAHLAAERNSGMVQAETPGAPTPVRRVSRVIKRAAGRLAPRRWR